MDIQEIKQKKQPGDFVVASKIVGINQSNAAMALNRPGSKHHNAVVSALEKIIVSREHLIASN